MRIINLFASAVSHITLLFNNLRNLSYSPLIIDYNCIIVCVIFNSYLKTANELSIGCYILLKIPSSSNTVDASGTLPVSCENAGSA